MRTPHSCFRAFVAPELLSAPPRLDNFGAAAASLFGTHQPVRVAVAVVQVLEEGVVLLLAQAGAAEQAEGESEAEARVHAGVSVAGEGATMHVHDTGAVRAPPGAGPSLQG